MTFAAGLGMPWGGLGRSPLLHFHPGILEGVCVHAHAHSYTCTCIHGHTCVLPYRWAWTQHRSTYVPSHTHTQVCTHTHISAHPRFPHVHASPHRCTYTNVHTHIPMCALTHVYTCTGVCACVHTHTFPLPTSPVLFLSASLLCKVHPLLPLPSPNRHHYVRYGNRVLPS